MIEQQALLNEIAQLALAVVGFSGIVVVLGQRSVGSWSKADIGRMSVMMTTAFRTLFAALFPLVLIQFGLADAIVWGWSSGIVALIGIFAIVRIARYARSIDADEHHIPWLQTTMLFLSFISIVINVLNAAGIVFDRSFGPYFLTLMIAFGMSCIYFVRLVQTAIANRVAEPTGDD